MKSSFLGLWTMSAWVAFSPFILNAGALPASHTISDVTVYPDRALVTRHGKLALPAGESQVVFEGLPANLDENSIRASAKSKGFQIRGVELRRDYKKPVETAASQKMRDQIKSIEEKKQDLSDERTDLEQKKSMLEKLANQVAQSGEDKAKSATVQDIKTFVDYYGGQISTVSTRLRAIERSQRDLDRQMADLQRELGKLQSPVAADQRAVLVTVEAPAPVEAVLDVNYLMSGASWVPQYNANARDEGGKIQLTSYGIVRQTTGEKWDDVRITLSTARPQQGTSVPELTAWTVNVLNPNAANETDDLYTARQASVAWDKRENSARSFNLRSNNIESKDLQEQLVSSQLLVSNVETRGFSAVYKVPGTVSVPSDDQPHRCTISIQDMAAKISYVTTPKLVSGTFVKAEVKNANEAPLLPGQLNIFMQNDFVGQNQLGLVGPEGVFGLFLGKDDAIKVTRKEKVRKEETSGVFSKSRVIRLGYSIEVENFKKSEQTVTVKDQLPLSQNEKITVKLANSSIAPTKENKDSGELTWELKVPSRGKQKIDLEIEIEAPIGMEVQGA